MRDATQLATACVKGAVSTTTCMKCTSLGESKSDTQLDSDWTVGMSTVHRVPITNTKDVAYEPQIPDQ